MEFDAFISHSSKDKTMADAVCAKLEQAGVRCWIAPRDIQPGKTWSGEIMKAIDQCKVMVLVFSSNANESVQIVREVESAVHRGKPVLPLRIEDIQPSDSMAFFMNSVHWLDAITQPHERQLDQLAQAVNGLLGRSDLNSDVTLKDIPIPPKNPPIPLTAPIQAPGPKLKSGFGLTPVGYAVVALVAVVVIISGVVWVLHLMGPQVRPIVPTITQDSAALENSKLNSVTPASTPAPALAPTVAPTPAVAPTAAPAPAPAAVSAVDPAMSGVWYIKTTILNLPTIMTANYGADGNYKIETVMSDAGTYSAGAGQWTTKDAQGAVQQGTYSYGGPHTLIMAGPLGTIQWTDDSSAPSLDPNNLNGIGTWQTTVTPPNSAPWNMTLVNRPDGTYSTKIDVVDQGIFTAGNGRMSFTSHTTGAQNIPATYSALTADTMEFVGPAGPATWSRKQP